MIQRLSSAAGDWLGMDVHVGLPIGPTGDVMPVALKGCSTAWTGS